MEGERKIAAAAWGYSARNHCYMIILIVVLAFRAAFRCVANDSMSFQVPEPEYRAFGYEPGYDSLPWKESYNAAEWRRSAE